jgi:L-threonylcarbamoyladenylate synthase
MSDGGRAPGEGPRGAERAAGGPAAPLGDEDAARLQRCLAGGGVAVFGADTVYGLGCDPDNARAVSRLYELKGRHPDRPAAVMFFDRELALAALGDLGSAERGALEALLPGPVTLLLPNRDHRFPLACGPTPQARETLGLRVPVLPDALAALRAMPLAMMQSSANLSGGPEARRLADVPRDLILGADLALDGGELPGTASTIVDLRDYERSRRFSIVREGALGVAAVERALA